MPKRRTRLERVPPAGGKGVCFSASRGRSSARLRARVRPQSRRHTRGDRGIVDHDACGLSTCLSGLAEHIVHRSGGDFGEAHDIVEKCQEADTHGCRSFAKGHLRCPKRQRRDAGPRIGWLPTTTSSPVRGSQAWPISSPDRVGQRCFRCCKDFAPAGAWGRHRRNRSMSG